MGALRLLRLRYTVFTLTVCSVDFLSRLILLIGGIGEALMTILTHTRAMDETMTSMGCTWAYMPWHRLPHAYECLKPLRSVSALVAALVRQSTLARRRALDRMTALAPCASAKLIDQNPRAHVRGVRSCLASQVQQGCF